MPRKSKKIKLLGGGMKADLLKQFIDLSYKGNTSIAPEGYDIDAPLSDSRVKVYQKKGSNQVIVTHRGSVGLQDWLDNAKFLVAGKVKSTKTYKLHRERHLKAVEKYGAENIIGIGHSRAGLYLQELQKEVPIKEIITYNKAVGFYDALRENPEEQTDVKVKNDFVSLLSGLQKRPKKMVEIDATSNPLDFNKAHQPAELEKLGDTFIGKKEETEGGKLTNPFYTPLPIVAADYIGRKTGLLGSGRAPSPKTIEQLNKILKTLEGKLEKINKGKVYKTTNKDKVSYDISYTKARIKNYEANGEDLIITKKKKYKDELPAKAKPYKAKPKKEEPKPEPPKPKPPKLKKQKAFLLTYKEPTPEPKKEEPKPEPKKEEPKPKEVTSPKLAKIEEFINDTENYLNKKSTRAFNALMKKYNDKDFIKSINSAQKFNDFYPTSQKCLSNYSSYLKNNFYEDEVILEPTAGLGSIVLWLLKNNVKSKIIATDYNQDINKYLKESFNGIDQVTILDHAKSDYLDMKNEYYKYNPSYIFLNPPFSNRNDKKYYLNFLYKALYDLTKSKHRIRERQLFFISPKLTDTNEKNDQSINVDDIDISKKKKEEIKKMLNINEDEWEELRPEFITKVNVCSDFGGTNTEAVLYHIIIYGDEEEEPKKEKPKSEPKKEEPKKEEPKKENITNEEKLKILDKLSQKELDELEEYYNEIYNDPDNIYGSKKPSKEYMTSILSARLKIQYEQRRRKFIELEKSDPEQAKIITKLTLFLIKQTKTNILKMIEELYKKKMQKPANVMTMEAFVSAIIENMLKYKNVPIKSIYEWFELNGKKKEEPKKEEPKKEEPIVVPEPEPTKKEIEPLVNKLENKIEEFEKLGREYGAVTYSGSGFIQVVAYIALLLEYEAKCAILGDKGDAKKKINSKLQSPMNADFYRSAEELSNDLLDCIHRGDKLIAIPLRLAFGTENTGHANLLIYRPYENTIERFEPHGSVYEGKGGAEADKVFNIVLKRMFEVEMKRYLKEYTPKFISPDQICPNPKGFQILEGSIKGLQQEGGGFCGMWSLFILELIFINPTKPTAEIIKEALAIAKEDPQYLKNVIRGYVLKTEKMLDNYIKKIDANDGFSFNRAIDIENKKTQYQEQLLELLLSFGGKNSRVNKLQEEVTTKKAKENKYKPVIDLLKTKSKNEINYMDKYVFRKGFVKVNDWSIKELTDTIIKRLETYETNVRDDLKNIKRDEIFAYFNEPPPMEGGYFWDSKETKDAKKAKREARQAEEKAKKEASRKELGEVLTTFASKINEIKKQKKATTAQKAVDTAPKAIDTEPITEEGQQGIEEGESMAGAGFYLDSIAYPINPIYYSEYYDDIPSIIEPEDLFLVGGSFTDMAGMNCDKTTGQCFNPVWEKQKIKRQILSEYKIWYWPWGAPPAGHIRMAWLEPMIQERYQPLYDEFVARRNVNIGLPADASKDRFAQQMFSNLTDGLSYVPIFNTVTSLGLSGVSALADTKKEDGT
jgi:hypothetical protein